MGVALEQAFVATLIYFITAGWQIVDALTGMDTQWPGFRGEPGCQAQTARVLIGHS
jgi:hypothetical protein